MRSCFFWGEIKTIYAQAYNNTAEPTLLKSRIPVVDFPVEADMVKVQQNRRPWRLRGNVYLL